MRTLDRVVLESSVFSGMNDLYAEQLAGCSRTVGFEAGETLFREGEPADVFYVLRRGRVALELYVPGRGPLTIETIEAGSVVGWSWLFAPHVWVLLISGYMGDSYAQKLKSPAMMRCSA